jgi:hypothetical protein
MTTAAPSWTHCGQDAGPDDPYSGCRGVTVTTSGRCLAHADTAEQAIYFASLSPGADLDLRGTTIDGPLLLHILTAVTDPTTRLPVMGRALFDSATFAEVAWFGAATFTREARFGRATFNGDALFDEATFGEIAWFDRATFTKNAHFEGAAFTNNALFEGATFTGSAWFGGATFTADAQFGRAIFRINAHFGRATFTGSAWFGGANFTGGALFGRATFTRHAQFIGVTFTGSAWFGGATFTADAQFIGVTFTGEAMFGGVTFTRHAHFTGVTFTGEALFGGVTFTGEAMFGGATFTRDAEFTGVTFTGEAWFGGATFTRDAMFGEATFERTRAFGPLVCAQVVTLSGASFGAAVTVEVMAKAVVFRRTRWAQPAAVWLRYADVDLTDAMPEYPVTVAARLRAFASPTGTLLDESALAGMATEQVRATSLRGVDAARLVLTDIDLSECLFAGTVHLDQLRLEGDCRFAVPPEGIRRVRLPVRYTRRSTLAEEHHWRHSLPQAGTGWQQPPVGGDIVQPRALAAVYRALRKSYEDSSNEPGAADFYYGEMEMRRADPRTPRAERCLLTAYWALSGYGLRATRALGWLLLAVTLTMLTMMLWGLPQRDTPSLSTGTLTGHRITMITDSPDPQNPTGPPADRLASGRFEKSLRVVVNSVIFRSSGQDLTTTGTYTEMASRLTEPVLLGLAVLAIRGRIKR